MADIFETEKEAEQAQRVKDLQWMKDHEQQHAFPIFRYEIINVHIELKIRLMQYVQQFPIFTMQYLIYQTLNDFNKHIRILQRGKKIDEAKPVAIIASGSQSGKLLYIDADVSKEDFKDNAEIDVFVFEYSKK